MHKQFDSKTGGLKNFLSGATAVFAVFAMIFSTTARAQTRSTNEAASPEATFTNSAPIVIPAIGNANPYPSTIAVAGLSGTIPATAGSVQVTLNGYSHTFSSDVGMVLVGPTGAALLLQDGAGSDATNATYTISDTGATILPDDTTEITAGTYKPTAYFTNDPFPAPGPGTTYGNPGPAGSGTATFGSIFGGTNPNGNWNLFIIDFVDGDSGSVSGGWTLTINGTAPPVTKALVDYNGDGRTDFSVARPASATATAALTIYNKLNLANNTGTETATQFGIGYGTYIGGASALGDVAVPADYDGDGRDDIAVWRAAAAPNAFFYIMQSSNNTVRYEQFGTTGDNPTTVGDWDGDGKADVSTYRPATAAGSQSIFFYRGSLNNAGGTTTYLPFGTNTDLATPGDYDNDGKMDASVYRPGATGVQGTFITRASGNGGITYTPLGSGPSGIVARAGAPIGDYDGDGKDDYAIVRSTGTGGNLVWSILNSGSGTITTTTFGAQATDLVSPGDYDGDGKADIAVWRSGSGTDSGFYFILQSSTGTVRGVKWGTSTTALSVPDTPVQFNFEH